MTTRVTGAASKGDTGRRQLRGNFSDWQEWGHHLVRAVKRVSQNLTRSFLCHCCTIQGWFSIYTFFRQNIATVRAHVSLNCTMEVHVHTCLYLFPHYTKDIAAHQEPQRLPNNQRMLLKCPLNSYYRYLKFTQGVFAWLTFTKLNFGSQFGAVYSLLQV